MDLQTAGVIALAIVVLLIIFLALRYRGRLKGSVKGAGVEATFDASNPQPTTTPGVKIDGAKSRAGGLQATDHTGRGADVKNVDTYGDINVTSEPHPKAEPPA